jgi:hypothetical protein
MWDLDTGKMVHTLEGHELSVFGAAVTPDVLLAVSASADWLCWTIMPFHGEHRAVFRKLKRLFCPGDTNVFDDLKLQLACKKELNVDVRSLPCFSD